MPALIALLFIFIIGLLIIVLVKQINREEREAELNYRRLHRDLYKDYELIRCAQCTSPESCSAARKCSFQQSNQKGE